jgi:signal transduction histidine kinase
VKKQNSMIHFVDKTNYLVNGLSMVTSIILILKPSPLEFLVFSFVVDPIGMMLANFISPRWYFRRYPQDRSFFFGVEDSQFAQLNLTQRKNVIASMLDFPHHYAKFMYYSSFFKAIPAIVYIVFFWKYERPLWLQMMLTLSIASTSYVYFYGIAYFGSRAKIGEWIRELHQKFDLRKEFEDLQLSTLVGNRESNYDFLMQTFIIFFSIVIQLMVLVDSDGVSQGELIVKLTVLGLIAIVLNWRIWRLSRHELVGGLQEILEEMKSVDFGLHYKVLALNASPLLANFGQTFNALTKRIASSEAMLRQQVFHEAERSRYETLGEISGLVAHDLSSPLLVTNYCLEELRRKYPGEDDAIYFEQMQLNVSQAIKLVTSLRARLKNTPDTNTESSFQEVHQHVWRLLETQFGARGLARVTLDLDPAVMLLKCGLPQMDLMHILDNLYRNSLANLLDNKIENPRISVCCELAEGDWASIVIADNGTGIKEEQFTAFTNMERYIPAVQGPSLGLRLIRRLIEQHGGAMELLTPTASDQFIQGSQIRLKLKRIPS